MGDASNKGNPETRNKRTPHVVVLTTSPRGHLASAFYWSMEVARHGILVTLVSFQAEIDQMISEHEAEIRSLQLLRFLPLPTPQGATPRDTILGYALQKSFDELNICQKLATDTEPPTCIVASMFAWLAKDVALDLQVPRYTLLGAGATAARLNQASKDLFFRGEVLIRGYEDLKREIGDGEISMGMGVPNMRLDELPPFLHNHSLHLAVSQEVRGGARGVLLNTFHDLEPEAMDALKKFESSKNQKFYAIGPLDPVFSRSSKPVVDELKSTDEDCLRWLDNQPPSSVVYVSFGSGSGVNPRQAKEIALGLESAKQRFLWVLPANSSASADLLPVDFEERVAEFGYIQRGWAPQVKLLSHPSTGAFLTHCGWNSILEAISKNMPMIAFPLTADQFMNCKYLVDKLKVAAEIRRGPDKVPEPNTVERAIRQVMEGEEGKAMKGRVQVLGAAAAAALEPDGSSVRDRHQFFEDVRSL